MVVAVDVTSPAATGSLSTIEGLGVIIPIHAGHGNDTEGYIPLSRINIFEQVRKTYEGIPQFADELSLGEINSVQIAIKTRRGMRQHLELLNRIWGTSYVLKDCMRLPSGPERYAVLISGHRRTLAKAHLWEHGCIVCRDAYGAEDPGSCYQRHFTYGGDLVKARLYYGITPYRAMEMQCKENVRGAVPAHEQADAYDRLFSLMLIDDPDLTLAKFARQVGHGPETVARARQFMRLPSIIREDVAERRMGYGVALELGRLHKELDLDEATLMAERATIIDRRLGLKVYKRHVDRLVQDQRSGVGSLFGLGDETAGNASIRRQVFEQQTVRSLYEYARYLEMIRPLIESGEMAPDGTWPDTSAVNVIERMLDAQEVLLPFLETRRGHLQAARAQGLSAAVRNLVEDIQELEAEPPLLSLVND